MGSRCSLSAGKLRLAAATAVRRQALQRAPRPPRRWNSTLSQRQGSDHVSFPGAVNSKFTTTLSFDHPAERPAMPTYRVMDSNGVIVDESRKPLDVQPEDALKWYQDMLTVNIMDLIMYDAQRQGRLSFYMVNAGEEGVAVGSSSALNPADVIFAQYREAGVFKERGYTLDEFMNQLFANHKDSGRGRNMPVHYGSSKLNIHTISSTLATQLPQATGAAYALKMANIHSNDPASHRVAAAYFGDGAASEGDFHAALNIAATRSCPIVFICRNNGFAISTTTLEQYRGDGIASRGIGYGIDTVRVDGNDIFAVREVTKKAREMALQDGGKPILIEAMSYRVSHHSTSDDSFAYRARVEVEDWKRRDNPITRLRKWMENEGIWDEEKEQESRKQIRKDILKAFAQAENEKKPAIRNLFTDVYEEVTEEGKAHMQELGRLLDTYPQEYDLSPYMEGRDGLNLDKK